MDEQGFEEGLQALSCERLPYTPEPQPIEVCKCLISDSSSESIHISERKRLILSTVQRTENYLRERRIPELINYIFCKVIASGHEYPAAYAAQLLDDCMLFRAGYGSAPVVYEDRHLEAIVQSFDPGNRGWLSAGQVRRVFGVLGLTPSVVEETLPTGLVLNNLREAQIRELKRLLNSGMNSDEHSIESNLHTINSIPSIP